MKRVAIQGIKGCFHEQAAYGFYESLGVPRPEVVECSSFEDLYKRMDEGKADAAIMAIENTVSGGLLPNFELLRIKQSLMALSAVKPLMTDLNILGEYEAAI